MGWLWLTPPKPIFEDLAYDDDQELKETREDIKHSNVMLGETEKKVIEDFLSLVADLGQQEDLMIESSNKTIESCGFKVDKLNVFASNVEDDPSYGIVLSEAESYLVRHNEEDVKHKYIVLEESNMEMLLLENLLEKSESNCEWKPHVNKLCFNSFDEEMKYRRISRIQILCLGKLKRKLLRIF